MAICSAIFFSWKSFLSVNMFGGRAAPMGRGKEENHGVGGVSSLRPEVDDKRNIGKKLLWLSRT